MNLSLQNSVFKNLKRKIDGFLTEGMEVGLRLKNLGGEERD
jgi:hypothetical protein